MTPVPTDRPLMAGDVHAIAKDAADRVHKNGGCVPQMAYAPILWALQDALSRPATSAESEVEGEEPWGWNREVCTGCSASLTHEEIKARGCVSCCPERRMVTVRDLVGAYEAALEPASPVSERERELEGALREIEAMCPATCETSLARDMAQIAAEALATLRNRTSEPETGEAWKDQRLSRIERVKMHRVAFGSDLKTAINAVDEHAAVANILTKIPAPATSDKLRVAKEALEPFAAASLDRESQNAKTLPGGASVRVTLAQCRKARQALAALNEPPQ